MQSGTLRTDDVSLSKTRLSLRRRRAVAAGITIVTLLLAWLVYPTVFTWAGHWLDVGEKLKSPVDCVMILGGEANTRPFLAAAIFRAGYARSVLFAPVKVAAVGTEEALPPHHEITRRVLLKRGVPEDAIVLLPGPVDSTRDEAVALGKFLTANPDFHVAIVTSNFHTRRTRMLFQRTIPAHRDRLHFVSCPTDHFGPDNWWQTRLGLQYYVSEFGKLVRDYFR